MPKYEIGLPTGQVYQIDVAEGVTPEQVQAQFGNATPEQMQEYMGVPPTPIKEDLNTSENVIPSNNAAGVGGSNWQQMTPQEQSFYARRGVAMPPSDPRVNTQMLDSTLLGFGNEVHRGVQALLQGIKKKKGVKEIRNIYDELIGQDQAAKESLAKESPGTSFGATIVPSMLTGVGSGALLKPSNVKQGLALAGVEGGIFGAGESEPGLMNRLKGGTLGSIFGFGGGLLGTALERGAKQAPKAIKGLADLFGGEKPLNPEDAAKNAELHLANAYRRQNRDIPTELAPDETIADSMGPRADSLIEAITAGSDEAANLGAKHPAMDRAITTKAPLRLQDKLRVGEIDGKTATQFSDNLELERKKFGGLIEDHINTTEGKPLKNQDTLKEFLALDDMKGVLKGAKSRRKSRTFGQKKQEAPLEAIDESRVDPNTMEDVNEIVIDEALAQEIGNKIQAKINSAKKGGGDEALYINLREQWEDLLTQGSSSKRMRELRTEYGKVVKGQRVFREGSEDFGAERLSNITKKLDSFDPEQKRWYQEGVTLHYADKPDALFKEIQSAEGRKKIAKVFGEGRANLADVVGEQEKTFQSTADALQRGIDKRGRIQTDQTLQNEFVAVKSLFNRLQGKRAYSTQGGAFLVANEIVDIINTGTLGEESINAMAKAIQLSGDDGNKLLQRLKDIRLPEVEAAVRSSDILRAGRAQNIGLHGLGANVTADSLGLQDMLLGTRE